MEEALDLLKYDGDVNDSLAEMRKKWGEGISVLHEAQFDEIGGNMPAARTKRDLRLSGRS